MTLCKQGLRESLPDAHWQDPRLHMFGDLGFVLLQKSDNATKLDARAHACMLVGYEYQLGTQGYRMWSYMHQKVYISRDVHFMRRMFNVGPKPEISMLAVEGIHRFMDTIPVETAIVNTALAMTLANVNQPDDHQLENSIDVLKQLSAPFVQASELFTPSNF